MCSKYLMQYYMIFQIYMYITMILQFYYSILNIDLFLYGYSAAKKYIFYHLLILMSFL